MKFSDYQELAAVTAKFGRSPFSFEGFPTEVITTNDKIEQAFDFANLAYVCLGLSGEAAEINNKVKKIWRDNEGLITEEHEAAIKGEMGDVIWYMAAMANLLGFDLDEIAQANLDKLKSRMERNVIAGSGDNR